MNFQGIDSRQCTSRARNRWTLGTVLHRSSMFLHRLEVWHHNMRELVPARQTFVSSYYKAKEAHYSLYCLFPNLSAIWCTLYNTYAQFILASYVIPLHSSLHRQINAPSLLLSFARIIPGQAEKPNCGHLEWGGGSAGSGSTSVYVSRRRTWVDIIFMKHIIPIYYRHSVHFSLQMRINAPSLFLPLFFTIGDIVVILTVLCKEK